MSSFLAKPKPKASKNHQHLDLAPPGVSVFFGRNLKHNYGLWPASDVTCQHRNGGLVEVLMLLMVDLSWEMLEKYLPTFDPKALWQSSGDHKLWGFEVIFSEV